MKRHATIIVLVLTALAASVASARTVSVPTFTSQPGSLVRVPVSLDDAAGCACIDVQLSYDAQVLVPVKVEPGTLEEVFAEDLTTDSATAGLVGVGLYAAGDSAAVSGSIAVVTFRVREGTADLYSDLTVTSLTLGKANGLHADAADSPAKVEHGLIRVAAASEETTLVLPGEAIERTDDAAAALYAEQINANADLKAALLKAPGDVVSGTDLTAYQSLFVAASDGRNVTFVLNETGSNTVETATKAADATALGAVLEASGETATMTVETPLAGFYYSLRQSEKVDALGYRDAADRNKLGGRDTISFTLDRSKASGFYQTIVSPTPQK